MRKPTALLSQQAINADGSLEKEVELSRPPINESFQERIYAPDEVEEISGTGTIRMWGSKVEQNTPYAHLNKPGDNPLTMQRTFKHEGAVEYYRVRKQSVQW